MKKLLTFVSAITAGAIGTAAAEVSVSGGGNFYYSTASGDTVEATQEDSMSVTGGSVVFSMSTETTNGITLAWALSLMEAFGNNEVPDDGRRYCVVGWEHWSQLMAIDQFSRSNYVGEGQLPFANNVTAKNWLGFMWFPHSGLSETDGSGNLSAGGGFRNCYAWHADACGHAIGADISSNMQFHNDKDSYFVLNKMQMNSCLIDAEGVFELELKK